MPSVGSHRLRPLFFPSRSPRRAQAPNVAIVSPFRSEKTFETAFLVPISRPSNHVLVLSAMSPRRESIYIYFLKLLSSFRWSTLFYRSGRRLKNALSPFSFLSTRQGPSRWGLGSACKLFFVKSGGTHACLFPPLIHGPHSYLFPSLLEKASFILPNRPGKCPQVLRTMLPTSPPYVTWGVFSLAHPG